MSHLQKIGFIFGCFILTITIFIATLDKQKLFFTIQENLSTYNVTIEPQAIKSKNFGFSLNNVKFYYNKSLIAQVKDFSFSFANINLEMINFENLLHQAIPFKVDSMTYSVLAPLKIIFKGEMGHGIIRYDLSKNSIFIELNASALMNSSKAIHYFKKNEKGVMIYEYSL